MGKKEIAVSRLGIGVTMGAQWRKKWLHTLVFLPGEFHGQRNLAGYSPWGCRVRHDWMTNTQERTSKGQSTWPVTQEENRVVSWKPREESISRKMWSTVSNADVRFVVVLQSISHVWLSMIPWTAAEQASLSFTLSWTLLKFMSIV